MSCTCKLPALSWDAGASQLRGWCPRHTRWEPTAAQLHREQPGLGSQPAALWSHPFTATALRSSRALDCDMKSEMNDWTAVHTLFIHL